MKCVTAFSAEMREKIKSIGAKANKSAGDLQPWPNYFDAKAGEFGIVSNFCDIGNARSALEIGCGNGFTSAMLSAVADKVVAFDLPGKAESSHSLGIDVAGELFARLGINNIDVVGGSAESLPFSDGSFDLVFSAYAIQYVKDKDKALNEIRRVLKPGGRAIMIMPNFTERLFVPVMKLEYIIAEASRRLIGLFRRKRAAQYGSGQIVPGARKVSAGGIIRYMALKPDGYYGSFIEELFRHTPWAWKSLFKKNGFIIKSTFSTEIFPAGVFGILNSSLGKMAAGKVSRLSLKAGAFPVIKSVGYSFGVVAIKP